MLPTSAFKNNIGRTDRQIKLQFKLFWNSVRVLMNFQKLVWLLYTPVPKVPDDLVDLFHGPTKYRIQKDAAVGWDIANRPGSALKKKSIFKQLVSADQLPVPLEILWKSFVTLEKWTTLRTGTPCETHETNKGYEVRDTYPYILRRSMAHMSSSYHNFRHQHYVMLWYSDRSSELPMSWNDEVKSTKRDTPDRYIDLE